MTPNHTPTPTDPFSVRQVSVTDPKFSVQISRADAADLAEVIHGWQANRRISGLPWDADTLAFYEHLSVIAGLFDRLARNTDATITFTSK